MKKISYLLLILCFSFLLGCSRENIKQNSTTTPLFYEVSHPNKENKLYLFGSIHAANDSLYPLPDYILNAYNNSDSIAVEFDLVAYEKNITSQFQVLSRFLYGNNKTIKDVLKKDIYESGVEILKNAGLYSSVIDRYQPIIWETLIESAIMQEIGLDEQYGIDSYFLNLAKENNKKIIELESAESQYNMLESFREEEQIYFLEEAIQSYEESKENTKELFEQYKKGNQKDLENFLFEEETNEYMLAYNDKMITTRNYLMFTNLKEKLKENETIFCTVGLAHIIGEEGLVDLFKKEGYKVTMINEFAHSQKS